MLFLLRFENLAHKPLKSAFKRAKPTLEHTDPALQKEMKNQSRHSSAQTGIQQSAASASIAVLVGNMKAQSTSSVPEQQHEVECSLTIQILVEGKWS